MNLIDIVQRSSPASWSEGDNIPWNEPGFSRRMLKEHLSQAHDAASRRGPMIDRHVRFIQDSLLEGSASRILDLGCGPGLYLQRLAGLGHTCRGIDFSPASIEYARAAAKQTGLTIQYDLDDLRKADFGDGWDLIMLIYGEFNVFKPDDACLILEKAWAALKPGGTLLLEPSPLEHISNIGHSAANWYTQPGGLFSERPHIVLEENFWDQPGKAATTRYYICEAESRAVERCVASYQGYEDGDFLEVLGQAGFEDIRFYPNLTGEGERANDFICLTARKASGG